MSEEKTANTMFEQAVAELAPGGRYASQGKPHVVGSPSPSPLVGPPWSRDPTGVEPPLGYCVDELPQMLTVEHR